MRIDDNGVATATMVRADKHNALDQAMFEGLVAAAEQLAGDTSVRAVVLHGAGKSFCSGLDVASFMGGERGTGVLLSRDEDRTANLAQRVSYDWSLVPAPVIAAIHGNCFGGGLQIALGADIRIAAPDAKLSIMEIKWGLVPDMGITQTLPRLLPIDVAKELTFTGRIVSGSEGCELGLITRTAADPLSAALALAGEIALKSPDAIRAAKRLTTKPGSATTLRPLLRSNQFCRPASSAHPTRSPPWSLECPGSNRFSPTPLSAASIGHFAPARRSRRAITAAALGAAPLASADVVPNMTDGVNEGRPSGSRTGKFIVGRDPGGAAVGLRGNRTSGWRPRTRWLAFDKLVARGVWRRLIPVPLVGLSRSRQMVTR